MAAMRSWCIIETARGDWGGLAPVRVHDAAAAVSVGTSGCGVRFERQHEDQGDGRSDGQPARAVQVPRGAEFVSGSSQSQHKLSGQKRKRFGGTFHCIVTLTRSRRSPETRKGERTLRKSSTTRTLFEQHERGKRESNVKAVFKIESAAQLWSAVVVLCFENRDSVLHDCL